MAETLWRDMAPEDCAASLVKCYGTNGALIHVRAMRPRVERMKRHWAEVTRAVNQLPFAAYGSHNAPDPLSTSQEG